MKKSLATILFFFFYSLILFSQDLQYNNNSNLSDRKTSISHPEINLYPNPVYLDFTLEFNTSEHYDISIINSTGEIVFEQKNIDKKMMVNCQNMQAGNYIMRFKKISDNSFFSQRIIKK